MGKSGKPDPSPKGENAEVREDETEIAEAAEGEVEEISDPDRPGCPRCGWHNTRPSHTRTWLDSLLRTFSLRAFRCRTCGNRFRAVRRSARG